MSIVSKDEMDKLIQEMAVEVDQEIFVEAKIQAKGFSTLHMTAELKNAKGKICATASTNLLIIKIPGK